MSSSHTNIQFSIRNVRVSDAAVIREIYRPYVEGSSVSFEMEVPDEATMQDRIASLSLRYPYLVAEVNGTVVGYAYAASYRERPAYQWCVETSVYVDAYYHHQGIAAALYGQLLNELKERAFFRVYAVITSPNPKSIRFHEKMGFTSFANYKNVGFKLDQWHDVIWMEKVINEGKPSKG